MSEVESEGEGVKQIEVTVTIDGKPYSGTLSKTENKTVGGTVKPDNKVPKPKPEKPEKPELIKPTNGGSHNRRHHVVKTTGKKRPLSEWNIYVKDLYNKMKNSNPGVQFKDALKEASKLFKGSKGTRKQK